MPRAAEIDQQLAMERGRLASCEQPEELPDGAMVTDAEANQIWLRWLGQWWRWSFKGYGAPTHSLPGSVQQITSPACIATLAAGYRPQLPLP